MRIISLNVGLPSAQRYEGRKVITGGAKKPVPRAVLRFGNFDGDRQADQLNHGGLRRRCASTHSTTTHTGGES
jgi:MOSC domain-containing protein YiiM